MIRPILEFASAIWSPYTQRNVDLAEAVLRRLVRFIFNNYSPYASVTEMLERIDFKTLAERRNESKCDRACDNRACGHMIFTYFFTLSSHITFCTIML